MGVMVQDLPLIQNALNNSSSISLPAEAPNHQPSLNITADIKDQIHHDSQELQTVGKLLGVQHQNGIWKIQIQWKGLKDPTWEEARTLKQDVPELMAKVLKQMTPKKTREALAKYFGSSST